ncbi:MAG: RraA family protein [Candidatus Melainabacteria bacterium]|nr:MAG: RraA family protein [Candidatus Melainabacteria bacterium]
MTTTSQTDYAIATAQIVDACMRLKLAYRIAPAGIKPITRMGAMIWGEVVPSRHYGSVDIFLEALETSDTQEKILVIDNQARQDEACIGDLIVLEAKNAGIKSIIVRGLHRDTSDLIDIGLPIFSYGAYPSGPARLDAREPDALASAKFEGFIVTADDTAFVDDDGVVFVNSMDVEQILEVAKSIRVKERNQSNVAAHGVTLREQFQFTEYLKKRKDSQDYTFRAHLNSLAKSIEE